ncbi:MAG: acyl carrier protein [Mariniblastus sp.]|jgi:acyl carrier protein
MGLDTVELVMEVEEIFDINISDERAQTIVNVGQLFDCIVEEFEQLSPTGTCLSASTFYSIKRGLEAAGVTETFGPSTRLENVVPRKGRRSFWHRLSTNTNLKLPELIRPKWINLSATVITLVGSLWIAAEFSQSSYSGYVFASYGFVSLIVLGIGTYTLTIPLATCFQRDWGSFRGLSESVLVLNLDKLKNSEQKFGSGDIFVVLKKIIVEQLGVDADEVTKDANFVSDLGCG